MRNANKSIIRLPGKLGTSSHQLRPQAITLSEEINQRQNVTNGCGKHKQVPYHVGELELLTGVEEQTQDIYAQAGEKEPEACGSCGIIEWLEHKQEEDPHDTIDADRDLILWISQSHKDRPENCQNSLGDQDTEAETTADKRETHRSIDTKYGVVDHDVIELTEDILMNAAVS